MERQRIKRSHYLAAFAIATLVFVGGILLGNYFSQEKLEIIDNMEQEIRMDTMGSELQYMLLAEEPCSAFDYTDFSRELFNIGTRLERMESQLGVDDPRVLELKEYYMLLEVRHWLLMNKAKEECGGDYHLILYFYSNEGDCDKCKKQGYVLNYLHNKYKSVNIYSFDHNIENPSVETLKAIYNIESAPALVVGGRTYNRFVKADEIEGLLNLTSSG
ncbi:MAG: hypothetical protein R6U32_00330 [Candidatus Woesearchaeota archaeon]